MDKYHKHSRVDCKHDLGYCGYCDTVYCRKCGKEWVGNVGSKWYVYYPAYPFYPSVTWTSTSAGVSVSYGGSTTGTATHICNQEHV